MGWTVVDAEEVHEEKRLCLSGSVIYVNIFFAFLEYRPRCGIDDIVEWKIMDLACFNA